MALVVEVLIGPELASQTGAIMLKALVNAAREYGDKVIESCTYTGAGELLMLYGVGAEGRFTIRDGHVAAGKRAIVWDLGYFGRAKITGHLRCSVDRDHPQHMLDATPPEPSRWNARNIALREDFNAHGPIILIGLGAKSRRYLREPDWESNKLNELRQRFPNRRVIYRPKPGGKEPPLQLETETDELTPIDRLLRGASLVVCRHSNVAVDAIVAGVPFEAEDGAALWLAGKPFTRTNRLDFLRRLAFWQWRATEALPAWRFLRGIVK